jgi:hypothetical protein
VAAISHLERQTGISAMAASALIRSLLGVAAIGLVSSCTFLAPRVDLVGTPRDLVRLNGEWWGEYVGDRDHARRGTIAFKLVAGEDHAHGDVVMLPEGADGASQRSRWDEPGLPTYELARRTHVLEIRFVMVSGSVVTGVIDRYWDPDRQTEAMATFRGRLADGTIEGTFVTTYASGAASTSGRWKVSRMR